MKPLKNMLEGLLSGMEGTLARGAADATAAMSDNIISGITSINDGKRQDAAIQSLRSLIEDTYELKPKSLRDIKKDPESWWIQFADDAAKWWKFVMMRKMGSYCYIVSIDGCDYFDEARYDRKNNLQKAMEYFSSDSSLKLYEINGDTPALDEICDKILQIMYMR